MVFFLADDDRYLNSTNLDNIKSLGEIKASIREVKIGGTIPAIFASVAEAEPVHERSKKAMAHRVKCVEAPFFYAPSVQLSVCRFGKEEVVKPQNIVNLQSQITDLRSIAVFTFKYRSIGMLSDQLYTLPFGIDQTRFVELLCADGIAPPDPDACTGKRKASDEGTEKEDGEDSDEEGDEAQLKALMVCFPSLPAHIVNVDRGLFLLGKDE